MKFIESFISDPGWFNNQQCSETYRLLDKCTRSWILFIQDPAWDYNHQDGHEEGHYDCGAALHAVPDLVPFSQEYGQVISDPALCSLALGKLSPQVMVLGLYRPGWWRRSRSPYRSRRGLRGLSARQYQNLRFYLGLTDSPLPPPLFRTKVLKNTNFYLASSLRQNSLFAPNLFKPCKNCEQRKQCKDTSCSLQKIVKLPFQKKQTYFTLAILTYFLIIDQETIWLKSCRKVGNLVQ